jgi:peptidoglycan/LPS O-acetylase OafA/YrhL
MNTARPHFNTLDGIRGLAAILVVIFHAEQFFGARPFPKSYLAVDVFFLLSGAVVANAYEHRLQSDMSLARFTWLRIVRIYPLYLLGTVLGVVAVIVAGSKLDASLPLLLGGAVLLLPTLATLIPIQHAGVVVIRRAAWQHCLRCDAETIKRSCDYRDHGVMCHRHGRYFMADVAAQS